MAAVEPDATAQDHERLVCLMVDYQAGGVEAFQRLYEALAGDLRRHFESGSDGGHAQDLVQETFLEMHRSRHTYLPPLPVRPWAFGIARNVLRRHRRTAWKRGRLEDLGCEPPLERAPPSHATSQVLEARDVDDALRCLPPRRRQAWELHHVQGLSFQEIGRRLGIPVGAAKLRSSRAMIALRTLLGVGAGRRHD